MTSYCGATLEREDTRALLYGRDAGVHRCTCYEAIVGTGGAPHELSGRAEPQLGEKLRFSTGEAT